MGINKKTLLCSLIVSLVLMSTGCAAKKVDKTELDWETGDTRTFIEAFGTVKALTVRNINVTFPAQVKQLFIREGQGVKMGEKLVELDLSDFKGSLLQKELELAEAEYELEKIRIANYNMTSKAAYVQKLKIETKTYELDLLKKKLQQDFLEETFIISNIKNGVVTELSYKEGDHISQDYPVLTILDRDSYIVRADVPEEFIGSVVLGSEVEIVPSAYPDRKFKGTVERIAELAFDKNGETVVTVDIKLTGNDGTLLPNFNVDIKIYTG